MPNLAAKFSKDAAKRGMTVKKKKKPASKPTMPPMKPPAQMPVA